MAEASEPEKKATAPAEATVATQADAVGSCTKSEASPTISPTGSPDIEIEEIVSDAEMVSAGAAGTAADKDRRLILTVVYF